MGDEFAAAHVYNDVAGSEHWIKGLFEDEKQSTPLYAPFVKEAVMTWKQPQ